MSDLKATQGLSCYLVGGAVRDRLLGRTPRERDWVVVGSTPAVMLQRGFQQVGKAFPVFLHPQTGEEYALARLEKPTGRSHQDFVFEISQVSLTDDLRRRDLTINAMAQEADGRLIDPYGGQKDLAARILRHVSPAFAEDPLRILRLARFYASLPDFEVAPETEALVSSMVAEDALSHLSAERIWAEVVRALTTVHPWRFFTWLDRVQAYERLWPHWMPWLQWQAPLRRVCVWSDDPGVRWSTGAWSCQVEVVQAMQQRWGCPKSVARLSALVQRWGCWWQENQPLSPGQSIDLLSGLDVWRRGEGLPLFVMASRAHGVTDKEADRLQRAYQAASAVSVADLDSGLRGADVGRALHQARCHAVATVLDVRGN